LTFPRPIFNREGGYIQMGTVLVPPTPLVPLVRTKLRNLQIQDRDLMPVQGDLDASRLLEI
jgi:hypothetical protein